MLKKLFLLVGSIAEIFSTIACTTVCSSVAIDFDRAELSGLQVSDSLIVAIVANVQVHSIWYVYDASHYANMYAITIVDRLVNINN